MLLGAGKALGTTCIAHVFVTNSRSAVRAILRDMRVADHDPEVESMLLDFTMGLATQISHRCEVLRKHVGSATVTEGLATAACAVVESESFEPPLSVEDILSEATTFNSKPLPLSISPGLEFPPPDQRLTAPEFELTLQNTSSQAPPQARSMPVPAVPSPPAGALPQAIPPATAATPAAQAQSSSSSSSAAGAAAASAPPPHSGPPVDVPGFPRGSVVVAPPPPSD